MKKITLIVLLLIATLVSYSQTSGSYYVVLDSISGSDTVLAPLSGIINVSGYGWAATVVSDADTNFIIDFGSSLNEINTLTHFPAFEGIESESLPYTFNPDSLRVITNQDTTVQHSFVSGNNSFGFPVPLVKIDNSDSATGGVTVYINFFK